MLLFILSKNITFTLYIFSFLVLIFKKLNIKKTIYFLFLISFNVLDIDLSTTAYCESEQEQSDRTEKILSAVLAEQDSVDIDESSIYSKKLYYLLGISLTLILAFGFYYYFQGGGGDLPVPSSNILNLNSFEESEVKFTQDPLTKRLDFNTTPQTTPEKALDRYTSDISPEYEKGIRILTDL